MKNFMKINLDFKLKSFTFLLTLIISLHFAKIGVDLHHHGIMVNGAMGLLSQNGKIYREFYYHYGPITAFLHAAIFYFFGLKLYYIQVFTCIVYALTSLLLFNLARLYLNSKHSFFSVVIYIFFAPYYILEFLPWSSVYIIPLFVLIFLILLNKKDYNYNFFSIGILIGLIFFIRQSSGIIAFLGLLVLIPFYKIKKILFSFLGFFLVFAISIFLLYKIGVLSEYYNSCFLGQKSMILNEQDSLINSIKRIFIDLLSIILTDTDFPYNKPLFVPYVKYVYNIVLIIFLFFIAFKFFIKSKFNLFQKRDVKFISISVFSFVSLSQMYPVTCLRHYYWAFAPVIPIIYYYFLLFTRSIRNYSKYLSVIFTSFLLFVIFSGVFIRLEIGIRRTLDLDKYFIKMDGKRFPILDGMFVSKDMKEFYDELYHNKDRIKKIIPSQSWEPYLIPFIISKAPIKHLDEANYFARDVDSLSNYYRHSSIFFPLNTTLYYIKKSSLSDKNIK
jgi:hypothetical protein